MRRTAALSPEMQKRMKGYTDGLKWKLAVEVGISPSTYSAWSQGIYSPTFNDDRAIKLGVRLGLRRDQVFAAKAERTTATPDTDNAA